MCFAEEVQRQTRSLNAPRGRSRKQSVLENEVPFHRDRSIALYLLIEDSSCSTVMSRSSFLLAVSVPIFVPPEERIDKLFKNITVAELHCLFTNVEIQDTGMISNTLTYGLVPPVMRFKMKTLDFSWHPKCRLLLFKVPLTWSYSEMEFRMMFMSLGNWHATDKIWVVDNGRHQKVPWIKINLFLWEHQRTTLLFEHYFGRAHKMSF